MAQSLNLDRLRSVTGNDNQLQRELAELFLSTADNYVVRMQNALTESAQDTTQWRSAAHALKGSSANFGAETLSHMARRAELSGPSMELLRSVRAQLDEIKEELEDRGNR